MSIPCSTFERGPPNLFESENIVDGGRYGGISFGGGEGDVRVNPRRTHRAGDPTVVRLSAHIYRRGHRYSGIGAGTSGAQWPDRKSPTHCHGRMDHLSSGEIGSPSSALTGKLFTVAGDLSLQQVLDTHSAVFKEGLGELQSAKAKIYIDKDERPRFSPPRQVSFAIK